MKGKTLPTPITSKNYHDIYKMISIYSVNNYLCISTLSCYIIQIHHITISVFGEYIEEEKNRIFSQKLNVCTSTLLIYQTVL